MLFFFFVLCQYSCVSDEAATAAARTDAWMWRPPGLNASTSRYLGAN